VHQLLECFSVILGCVLETALLTFAFNTSAVVGAFLHNKLESIWTNCRHLPVVHVNIISLESLEVLTSSFLAGDTPENISQYTTEVLFGTAGHFSLNVVFQFLQRMWLVLHILSS